MSDQTDDVNCNDTDREYRIHFCTSCENLNLDDVPKCTECNCSISLLTTFKFKSCPIGKW